MTFLARMISMALLLSLLTIGAMWLVSHGERERLAREIAALEVEMARRVAERDAMIERLSRSRRIAVIDVVAQRHDDAGAVTETDIEFIEVDEDGRELGRMAATVPGDTLFIDSWVVKFDPRHVAEGHPLFGRSLVLFRRLYSDRMAPTDGIRIDTPGAVPTGYVGSERARFEQQIWSQFWQIAADPEIARSLGVRAAQGEAVYLPVRSGQMYELTVDAVGGTTFRQRSARLGLAR